MTNSSNRVAPKRVDSTSQRRFVILIGTPLTATLFCVVRSQEQPIAAPGEAYNVGAVGTAGTNGHFHRNDLTGKRLVDFAGSRVLRTDGRADRYAGPAINRTFGVRLPLRTVFDAPTVQRLARRPGDALELSVLESMSDEAAKRLLGATSGDSAL